MASATVDLLLGLIDPWKFLYLALTFLPGTLSRLQRAGHWQTILSWSSLQDAWFKDFWSLVGPNARKDRGPRIIALFDGKVENATVTSRTTHAPLSGVVLEIGPGQGYWTDVLRPFNERGSLKSVYAIEPNREVHDELKAHAEQAGLEGVHEIIPRGIQAIDTYETSNGRIEKGSVDCIVTILCLCSIPEPEKNIKELYEYLKPGGRWYLYEHTKVRGPWWLTWYQHFINLFWPQILNGCQMCRDTRTTLKHVGPWTTFDLEQPPEEPWYALVPHIMGTLVK